MPSRLRNADPQKFVNYWFYRQQDPELQLSTERCRRILGSPLSLAGAITAEHLAGIRIDF